MPSSRIVNLICVIAVAVGAEVRWVIWHAESGKIMFRFDAERSVRARVVMAIVVFVVGTELRPIIVDRTATMSLSCDMRQ